MYIISSKQLSENTEALCENCARPLAKWGEGREGGRTLQLRLSNTALQLDYNLFQAVRGRCKGCNSLHTVYLPEAAPKI